MAFKSDRSFLDKLTMGALGTTYAKNVLMYHGHKVIELERCSTSNKIWSTKVKRLRIPDLLCVNCGRRMEVRSKSTLKITMSDSPSIPHRRWDYGLRDDDLVLLIACNKDLHTSNWVPSSAINAFTVGDLRATVHLSRLGPPKSAAEGAERDRTWPCYVPSFGGQVIEVKPEFISVRKVNGRRQTYSLVRAGYHPHVFRGQTFEPDSVIAASVVPRLADLSCHVDKPFDFIANLAATDRETLYCAVKALGRLPEAGKAAISHLLRIAGGGTDDQLVRLEAYASLARLGYARAWKGISTFLQSGSPEVRMEAVLILGELNDPAAQSILSDIASNHANDSELRAAAVWEMGHCRFDNPLNQLLPYFGDDDHFVAIHAIVASLPYINAETLPFLLQELGPPHRSAAVVRAIVESNFRDVNLLVDYLFRISTEAQKPWILYLFGLLGEEVVRPALVGHGKEEDETAQMLSILWNQHFHNWTNEFSAQDLLDYTLRQNIRGT
ncbi:MAG: hypothetical protein D9V47_00590 [Clostridia bacterium]|nr:MAG: hypothetical protein D9V47_00590 [Clostridia bacterium]